MKLHEAQQILKNNGFLTEKTDEGTDIFLEKLGTVISLEKFNDRLARFDEGWKIVENESNKTVRVFTIGKQGIGKFKVSLLISYGEKLTNLQLEIKIRLIQIIPDKKPVKDINKIIDFIFGW